jgi:acyl-CoA thioesterase-2
VAHALLAATRTVSPDRTVHSLHSQFLERGDPDLPIRYHVTCTRDGGTFASRQVEARQDDRVIFTQSCSFQETGPGPAHQIPWAETLPDPLSLPSTDERVRSLDETTRRWWKLLGPMFPLEVRFLDEPARARTARGERVRPRERFYVRFLDRVDDHPAYRDAALAYLTDLFLLSAGVLPHRLLVGVDVTLSSLDHAIWFHAQVPVGAWLLHEVEASWAGGGRALARGHLFALDGALVATTMQEGFIRPVR